MIFLFILLPYNQSQQFKLYINVESVTCTRNLPSYAPIAFKSGLDRTHLIFSHQNQRGHEYITDYYYHTYKLANDKWVLPTKFISNEISKIYNVTKISEGFLVYYKYTNENGIFRISYEDNNNVWSKPFELFGNSKIIQFLNISDLTSQELDWGVHSFFFLSKTIVIIWSFKFIGPSNLSHDYENKYIVTKLNENGSVYYQPLRIVVNPFGEPLIIAKSNGSIFIYRFTFSERAILFQNGTWRDFQLIDYNPFSSSYYPSEHQRILNNRYLIVRTEKRNIERTPIWLLVDIVKENLIVSEIKLPSNPSYRSISRIDFEHIKGEKTGLLFIMSLLTNKTIELWNWYLDKDEWNLISSFNYDFNETIFSYYDTETFSVDLCYDNINCELFWSQRSNTALCEIFTVAFNTSAKNWSKVTQITNSSQIMDDYTQVITGFLLPMTVLYLLLTVIIFNRRKMRSNRK